MVMTDPLGDLLTRIRNAQMRGNKQVVAPASKLAEKVLAVLEKEGFIKGFSRSDYGPGSSEFDIQLKYYDGVPVIRELKRVSKPGRRVYSSIKGLAMVRNGLGVAILSTPKGVMSDAEARNENVGGEVLCNVF